MFYQVSPVTSRGYFLPVEAGKASPKTHRAPTSSLKTIFVLSAFSSDFLISSPTGFFTPVSTKPRLLTVSPGNKERGRKHISIQTMVNNWLVLNPQLIAHVLVI